VAQKVEPKSWAARKAWHTIKKDGVDTIRKIKAERRFSFAQPNQIQFRQIVPIRKVPL